MAAQENDRIDRQRIALGPEGLASKGQILADAMDENGRLPPNEMLTQVPIPSPTSIQFHPLRKYRLSDLETDQLGEFGFHLAELPSYAEAYDVHTNFVYMIVTLNTAALTTVQRSHLFLLLDLLTESPVRRADGTLLPHEDVVTALERDTITMGTHIGLESASQFSCGPFSDCCTLMLQVEPKKYGLGAQWLADLLQRSVFQPDRIRVCASKITNAVSQAKRRGNAIVSELLKAMFYRDDSNVRCSSMLRQHKFLNALLERLDIGEESAAGIVAELNAVREIITRPENLAVHVAADWRRLSKLNVDLTGPWAALSGDRAAAAPEAKRLAGKFDYNLFTNAPPPQVQLKSETNEPVLTSTVDGATVATESEIAADTIAVVATESEIPADTIAAVATESEIAADAIAAIANLSITAPTLEGDAATGTGTVGTVVGLGCIESAFLYHATPAIHSFNDPDLPALMLFLQYLTQLEGPLWRQIRGQGFAYGYNLMPRPNEGLLYFTLYRATNVVAAYRETQSIVEAQLRPDAVWDETLLASAKSSLIFEIIERERSVGDLVVQALLGSFKQVSVEYNQQLVQQVNGVTVEELQSVGERYVAKLFGCAAAAEARTAIVCHPDKAADIAEAFAL